MATTFLEKLHKAGFQATHTHRQPDGTFPGDHHVYWKSITFKGKFRLDVIERIFEKHLEENGTPWQEPLINEHGEEFRAALGLRTHTLAPDLHIMFITPERSESHIA